MHRLPGGWRSAVPAAEAVAALAITQVSLRFCRFQTIRRGLLAAAKLGRRMRLRPVDTTTLVWAVQQAKRRCPVRSTCLGHALVAEALLHQYGYKPVLCIGAARRNGSFQAHAWLEQNDAVVIGGPKAVVEQYTRFPEIDSLTL